MQSSIWKIITAIGIAGVGTLAVLEVQHRLPPAGSSVSQTSPSSGGEELTSETTVTPNAETDFDRLMSGSESNAPDFGFSEPPSSESANAGTMSAALTSESSPTPDADVINTKVNRQNLIDGEDPFSADSSLTAELTPATGQAAGAIPADATAVRPVSFVPGTAQSASSPPKSFDTDNEDSLFTSGEPQMTEPPELSETPETAFPAPFSTDLETPRLPLPDPAADAPDAGPFGEPGDAVPDEVTDDEAPPFEIPPVTAPSPAATPRRTPPAENGSSILFFSEGSEANSPAAPVSTRPKSDPARRVPARSDSRAEPQPNPTAPFDSESSLPAFEAVEPENFSDDGPDPVRPRETPPFHSDDRFDDQPEPDLPAEVVPPARTPARIPARTPDRPARVTDESPDSDEFPLSSTPGRRDPNRADDDAPRSRDDRSSSGDMFPLDDPEVPRRNRGRVEDTNDAEPGRGGNRNRTPRTFEDPLPHDSSPPLLPAVDEDRRATPGPGRRDSSATSDVIHPHLTIRKKAPPTASVGVPLEYEIFVSNDGQTAASDVVIEDELPQDVTLEKTQPKADFDRTTGKIIWQFDEIAPGENRQLMVRVIPTGEGTLDGVATVRFKTQVKGSTVITAPRLELELTGPAEVRVGDEVPFRYVIRNTGTGDAKDVILRSVLPPEFRHTEGNDLEYDIKSLNSGEEKEIVLSVIAAKEGQHTNRAEITSSGVATASAESAVKVVGAQLQLERLGPERRYVGRTAKFQNIITNNTNFEATDARVLEFVPEGMKFSAAPDGEYNAEDRTITWHIDRIPPGKQVVLDVELTAETAGSFDAVVEVVENAGFRSQGTKTIAVEDLHNVSADISHIDGPVPVGEKIKFAITIDNRGTATASEVQLQVQVPAQIAILAAGNKEHGVKARKGPGNSVIYNPVVRIEPNQKQTFQLVLQGHEPVRNGMVVAQLKYAEMQEPLVVSESVTVYAD